MAANLDLTGDTIASTYVQLLHTGATEGVEDDDTAHYLTDGNGTQSTLSISTTRVGIGTETPNTHLDVSNATGGVIQITRDDSAIEADDPIGKILFVGTDPSGNHTGAYIAAVCDRVPWEDNANNKSTSLNFYTQDDNDTTTLDAPRMTIDRDGRIGIGTAAPQTDLHVDAAGGGEITLSSTDTTLVNGEILGSIYFSGTDSAFAKGAYIQAIASDEWDTSGDSHDAPTKLNFHTQSNGGDDNLANPRMTILETGNTGIGTDTPGAQLHVTSVDKITARFDHETGDDTVVDGDTILYLSFNDDNDATAGHYIQFADSGTNEMTGTIVASSGTATNNTVSDYRLKQNINLITGGLERVNALKPSYFNYKRYSNKVHQGFIAHEVVEADIGYAVMGEKDAVNDDGSIKQQQFAITNIIPQMVSAIQELSAKVTALENA